MDTHVLCTANVTTSANDEENEGFRRPVCGEVVQPTGRPQYAFIPCHDHGWQRGLLLLGGIRHAQEEQIARLGLSSESPGCP
jgi:hypothetical protein